MATLAFSPNALLLRPAMELPSIREDLHARLHKKPAGLWIPPNLTHVFHSTEKLAPVHSLLTIASPARYLIQLPTEGASQCGTPLSRNPAAFVSVAEIAFSMACFWPHYFPVMKETEQVWAGQWE